MVIVCDEMQKLRDYLDKNSIEWVDRSTGLDNIEKQLMIDIGMEHLVNNYICRTHFNIGEHHVSVINGHGSYGGFCLDDTKNEGLLEIMCDWLPDVEGYLTAEDVI